MAEQLAELNKGDINDVWSTTETCIGTYDGKPLYRRLYKLTSPSAIGTNTTIYSGLTADMKIKNIYGCLIFGSNSEYPINAYVSANSYVACWRRTTTDLGMVVGNSAYVSCPVEITLEYTKS